MNHCPQPLLTERWHTGDDVTMSRTVPLHGARGVRHGRGVEPRGGPVNLRARAEAGGPPALTGRLVAGAGAGQGRGQGRLGLLLPLDGLLELEQLAHEVEVGRDDGAPQLDELVRLARAHGEVLDEVGDGDGGGARDPRLAVDQDRALAVPRHVDEGECLLEILFDVLRSVVRRVQLLVGDGGRGGVARRHGGHVQHVVDAEALERGGVRGVRHVAEEEEGGDLGGGVVLDVLGVREVGGRGRGREAGDVEAEADGGPHQVVLAHGGLGGLQHTHIT